VESGVAERNIDKATVAGFGAEWSTFDQSELSEADAQAAYESYFSLVNLDDLPADSLVVDVGCGSGRWAARVAPRVARLALVDPSPELASREVVEVVEGVHR